MTKMLIQNYIFTIVSYIMLMISIITINLLHQPLLKVTSYFSLPLSLIITIYGLLQINKTKRMVRVNI